uniref:Uncharacterized protein n=1 Tax=Glossina austeni TaxID=7395 RepID=A0A1A9VMN5_GLOAU
MTSSTLSNSLGSAIGLYHWHLFIGIRYEKVPAQILDNHNILKPPSILLSLFCRSNRFWLLLPISLKKYLFTINFYLSYIMGKSRSGSKERLLRNYIQGKAIFYNYEKMKNI